MIFHRIPAICLAMLLASSTLPAKAPVSEETPANATGIDLGASVVRIAVTDQEPDYYSPWNAGHLGGGIGSGFVIERADKSKRILTNAHVVSNARFITLTREGLSHPFTAHVEFIAHDCDLAQLAVDDPSFFEASRPLELGGIPAIESAVSVYGYPLGGERLGVTRGVVSRIDFDTYTHSAVDSHLAIQIDAAINPGNSGGPVLQGGKVVGVAFQGYSGDVAQNVGFMIPTPVINRFLKDISKGSYTGYTDLSMAYRPIENEASRKALGLTDPDHGVLVTDVQEKGSSFGHLEKGDILLAIDAHPVASNGRVELEGQSVDLSEVVERKFSGDPVSFSILRGGKPMEVSFPLQGTWPFHMQANAYDEKPRYLLHGGLLFQPLDRNFINAEGRGNLRFRHAFENFVEEHLYLKRPEIVVLSRVLADPVNKDCDGLQAGIVDTINGKKIRSLEDAAEAFREPSKYDVIILEGNGVPIVLKRSQVLAAEQRILQNYGIPSPSNP
jgi:S1-C subfamily serine protease